MKPEPITMPTQASSATCAVSAQGDAQGNAMIQQAFLTFLACAILLLSAQAAYAWVDTPMGNVLCNIVDMVYGNLGRGLATLAVVIIGVGATLGKTSWGLAMTVAVGIAVIFNAGSVVSYLGAGGNGC